MSYENYITEKTGGFKGGSLAASGNEATVDVDVEEALGRPATTGYIIRTAGTMSLKINDDEIITIDGTFSDIFLSPWLLAIKVKHIWIQATGGAVATFRLILT
jgi:hypothetical protein